MKRVTRDVSPGRVRDLLERVPRACLAYATEQGPRLMPVDVVWRDDRVLVRLAPAVGGAPAAGTEVVLLVDEGMHWFDLRAIYLRGVVQPTEAPVPAGGMWCELVPMKTVAWDYGQLRAIEDGDTER